MKIEQFKTAAKPTWCPGCGNYSLWNALKKSLAESGIDKKDFVLVSGIGCSGKDPYWVNTYGFCGLHGRPLPVATGVKLANLNLKVIACGGDGDGYSEGGNHFLHTCRRNIDLTYIVHNNQIYGLTTGQASPTSKKGLKTKSTPFGNKEEALNPLAVAITSGASFVGRGFAGDIEHLSWLFKEAIKHKGFALVDVLQPCVTFNKENTFEFFRERCYKLEEKKHDFTDKMKALEKAMEWDDIPIGIFYKVEKPVFDDKYSKVPLVKQRVKGVKEILNDFY